MKKQYQEDGFTLIEVMCVVAIMGILMAIAIPAYRGYVLRSYNTEAFNALGSAAMQMQQYYQDQGSYTTNTGACGIGATPAATQHFNYACVATASTFTVTATGNGVGGLNGYVFTIDDANNQRTTAYPNATVPAACWLTSSGGC